MKKKQSWFRAGFAFFSLGIERYNKLMNKTITAKKTTPNRLFLRKERKYSKTGCLNCQNILYYEH